MDDFERVAAAIDYLIAHRAEQPSLDDVAAHVGLSRFHFQRLFKRYAGVTPKQFLAALTLESAKPLLDRDASVLDAALDVCACEGSEELLWALVDKSLVVAEPGDEEERYRFLESTREYARRRLDESGEADAFAERHARWTLAFAERAKALLETMPDRAWFALIDAELDNVRAALDWSLRRGHAPLLGAALVAALGEYWPPRQRREGRAWLEAAQAAVDAEREPALAASVALGLAATLPLSVERAERAAQIVAAFRHVGDMTWDAAADYLTAKMDQTSLLDPERGRDTGMKQFLDDKSFRPGLGTYKRTKS